MADDVTGGMEGGMPKDGTACGTVGGVTGGGPGGLGGTGDEEGRAPLSPSGCSLVVVASGNAHKVKEIEAILGPAMPGVSFVPFSQIPGLPEPEETGTTFEENAFIKAQSIHDACGLPTVADDSGLVVDALSGAPGVYSARYAGEHGNDAANNAKLLRELEGVEAGRRTARFVSCVAFVDRGVRISGTGCCEGRIGFGLRGSNGFGYDPLFLLEDVPGKTMAELEPEEKNAVSHRRRAIEALAVQLRALKRG